MFPFRRLLILLPTISTGLVRLVQLAILLVLSNIATGDERNLLVAGFGLLSSFAMMTDSGAGNFLLSTPLANISRAIYNKAIVFHFGLAVLGSVLAIAFIAVPANGEIPQSSLTLLVAFAVTQSIDSTSRIVRAPAMVATRDAAYALPDVVLLFLKLPILALAVASADLRFLLLLPIPSFFVVVVTYALTRSRLPINRDNQERIYRRILEFGATGALSAFYSQSPLLIATTFLPLGELATLTIVYRIIQALDLVPGTLSLQMIPRVRNRTTGPGAYWIAFFIGGALISAAVLIARPLIEFLFGEPFSDIAVFVLVALSFAPKSGNYALVAFLMGKGLIRTRLVLTVLACLTSLGLAFALVVTAGVTGLAVVTLTVEFLFAAGGFIALRRLRIKDPALFAPPSVIEMR
jgi:O-antigen/teichoic acid export membrane protein